MSSLVVTRWRIYLFREGCWRVWVGEGEEAEVSNFEIAQKGRGSSSWSKVEEILIVVVNDEG